MTCPQGAVVNYTQLQEHVSMLKQDENKIAGIIAARTKLTEGEIRQLFHQGESKDLTFAIEKASFTRPRTPTSPKTHLYDRESELTPSEYPPRKPRTASSWSTPKDTVNFRIHRFCHSNIISD